MDQNYSPLNLPSSSTLPPPMSYSRTAQYPMPDAEPRPLFTPQHYQQHQHQQHQAQDQQHHQQHQQHQHQHQQQPQQQYSYPQQLTYAQPQYGNGIPYGHPQSPHYPSSQPAQLPPMSTTLIQPYHVAHIMDTTGQVPPAGIRPRLTTSIFEEEGSLCFQVDVNGICVARREDNHMINGTKLLNVAQMTRGRRDGILKAEKQKSVVKIGPMHLKGVWIPFDRALALANQEQITERLYPLFVHQIDALLYHPANAARPVPLPGAYPEEQRMSPTGVQSSPQFHDQQLQSPLLQEQAQGQVGEEDDDRRPRL